MMQEVKKSFNAILYERTTSPLFGTFILTWIIWNWKIIYLTLFVSEDKIQTDKIEYIISNFNDNNHLITYPIISTILLITVAPFISNGAYWLSLNFIKWKKDQKNKVEKKQLLTIEQSIDLREQISNQEARFEKLLNNKNLEIQQLNAVLEEQKNNSSKKITSSKVQTTSSSTTKEEYKKLAERIKNNPKELAQYKDVIERIQAGSYAVNGDRSNSMLVNLLESYEVIENKGSGIYKYTDKGKPFLRLMTD